MKETLMNEETPIQYKVIKLTDKEYKALERALQWPEDLPAYDRLNTPIKADLFGNILN